MSLSISLFLSLLTTTHVMPYGLETWLPRIDWAVMIRNDGKLDHEGKLLLFLTD